MSVEHMWEFNSEEDLSKAELVDFLQKLAAKVEQGTFTLEQAEVTLPDEIPTVLRLENHEHSGHRILRLELFLQRSRRSWSETSIKDLF
jgi:amphi-Trp domain-containing protein